jgi:hypothetical protein
MLRIKAQSGSDSIIEAVCLWLVVMLKTGHRLPLALQVNPFGTPQKFTICEMAAVETASVISIMMMAASCAKPLATSLIPTSPHENRSLPNPPKMLCNVHASRDRAATAAPGG